MPASRPHAVSTLFLALAAAALVAACDRSGENGSPTSGAQPLTGDNGFSPNGLNRNGLNRNGLNRNGLNRNGLNGNGLASPDFAIWFDLDAPTSDMVMSYVVKCAVPFGQTRSWTSPTTGAVYTWTGALGLLPGWAAGGAMTTAEEQVLTACLAAHVNRYGAHVLIAVEGRSAAGAQIPLSRQNELTSFPVTEAAFFGNLIQDQGIFVCLDHPAWDSKTSSIRACALDTAAPGAATQCAPIVFAGSCSAICTQDLTNTLSYNFYATCTYNGITYQPLETRLRSSDVYTCGDGICQFTEQCGTGTTAASCKADCGLCP
jgi:hypothetical protein